VKTSLKQVIEGKAASKILKKQSDAVATMGTKAKLVSAGVAMYQAPVIQGFRSGQTREISPTTASFFHSCNIPAHNANAAPVFREVVQAIKMEPASYAPPNNAAVDGELLEMGLYFEGLLSICSKNPLSTFLPALRSLRAASGMRL
jgi:hypothetical protein